MFLTKKALRKILLLSGAYLALSAFSFLIVIVFAILQIEFMVHLIIGVLCLAVSPLIYQFGRYAEGKGKLIAKGNKLILHQLRPMEFIRLYEEKRNDPSNVFTQPDFDVLHTLIAAYDALDETDRALEVVDQMIAIAPKKKIHIAKLLKSSLLFNIGQSENAEAIYRDVVNSKMNMISRYLSDVVMKSDRALALGDDTTAECHFRQSLNRKTTSLARLYAHYHLAQICHRTDRLEEANSHLAYCIENSGETGIKGKITSGEIFV